MLARLLVVSLVAAALAFLGLASPAAAATTISGTVTLNSGGAGPAGTTVVVRPAGGGTALASTTIDPSTGAYSVSVTATAVDVVVTAPDGSGLGQTTVDDVDATRDRTVDVVLVPAEAVSVSGVVRDGSGEPLSGVLVS
ncbi:hypothetical protein, partial [Nocardioides sp. GY 10127]|uniref:hypothetical protein n=1 Tax=Nocardioides sp. GY 10127 TaxID=2569762 RepID=UPI00197FEB6E